MTAMLAAFMILVLSATPLLAAGLGTPTLSQPIATTRFFDPDRFLTTGGLRYAAAEDLKLEPEWGVGYRTMERDLAGAMEESTHRVHAQAGWRLSLADTLYLSAAAKLPVVTFESTGRYTGQELGTRHDYDFARPFKNSLTWTGEVGMHLSTRTDFTLYYDQSPTSDWFTGGPRQEERIGTRLIWRFK
jgi:hypothetical protein